jgi:hypothetical protein
VLTAAGTIRVARAYFVCRVCRLGGHAADERLGVSGGRSRQAERLLCLAGGSWSFDAAARHLKEFAGLSASDNTIRQVCHQCSGQIADWRHRQPEAQAAFRAAAGEVEFESDGTCVNTYDGWREMRVGVFAKRAAGAPATLDQWEGRPLPVPTARVAFAAIEPARSFTARWRRWAGRLGVKRQDTVHAVADGARWIWEGLANQFAQLDGVLDVYHALQHLAAAARGVHGEGTPAAQAWFDELRGTLLAQGGSGVDAALEAARQATRSPRKRQAIDQTRRYFRQQAAHLNYAAQLAAGRTIGSGLIEGACKHVIGRRLKQTGARWRIRRANRMATLCCTLYSDHWDHYWTTAA